MTIPIPQTYACSFHDHYQDRTLLRSPGDRDQWRKLGSGSDDESSLGEEPRELLSSSYPPSYHSFRFRHGQGSPRQGRHLRKCAYVVSVVEPELFISKGAIKLAGGIYLLKQDYDGSSSGETSATIGIAKYYIKDLFDCESFLYELLRHNELVAQVPGIKDLSPYRLTALKLMYKFFYFVHEHELILLNIEPKGSYQHERIYPSANICIPGGGLETQDGQSFEVCARREFAEEVHFFLPVGAQDIKLITKQKFIFNDRQAMYFMFRVKKLLEKEADDRLDRES